MSSKLDQALEGMLSKGGVSDVLFAVGKPPQIERYGELVSCSGAPLRPDNTATIVEALLGGRQDLRAQLDEEGSVDVAYETASGQRFRVNVYSMQGDLGVVLRALPADVPTPEGLGLPDALREVRDLHNGLVLVTGSTGSGKSTTLAAMVHDINHHRAVHVVTLEDPIEFRHVHQLATVSQRELGVDYRSFADGLRAALRQAPKVILVGEMRDPATVEIALKAAETGHLVLSTLHTIDAGQTIGRLVGMFDHEAQGLVRSRLAETLRFVVAQRLLPKEGGGRVAAQEIMGNSLAVQELILRGETPDRTFQNVIADGSAHGWQTFDQHILRLASEGLVSEQTALSYCTSRQQMGRGLDQLRSARGEATSELGELAMNPSKRIAR